MVSLRLWVTHDSVVSCRLRRVQAVDDALQALDRQDGPASAGALVYQLAELLADGIQGFVDQLDEQLRRLEEAPTSDHAHEPVLALRRQAVAVRRYLAPQKDALDGLLRIGQPVFEALDWFNLREQADRTARSIEDLELLLERAVVLHEAHLQQAAQAQNQRLYALSIVATIFLPLGFLTGLFGVNLAGLPGTEDPRAFAILCGAMVAAAIGLFVLLRLRRWF